MELLVVFYVFIGCFAGAIIGVTIGRQERLAFARKVADEFNIEQEITATKNYRKGVYDGMCAALKMLSKG